MRPILKKMVHGRITILFIYFAVIFLSSVHTSLVCNNTPFQYDATTWYFFSIPKKTATFPLVVFFDGSACKSAQWLYAKLHPLITDNLHAGLLVVEKQGIGKDGSIDLPTYHRDNNVLRRVHDAHSILCTLKEHCAAWDGTIIVMGASEGGVVAALLAAHYDKQVRALITFSCCNSHTLEEMMIENPVFIVRDLQKSSWIARLLPESILQWAVKKYVAYCFTCVDQETASTKTTLGHSYAWWRAIRSVSEISTISAIACPVYAICGSNDPQIEDVRNHPMIRNKENFKQIFYDGLDHGFIDAWGKPHFGRAVQETISLIRKDILCESPHHRIDSIVVFL